MFVNSINVYKCLEMFTNSRNHYINVYKKLSFNNEILNEFWMSILKDRACLKLSIIYNRTGGV